MSVLLKNKGKAVSREKLMQALWETDSFVDENTLSVNVNRLRKRLWLRQGWRISSPPNSAWAI